jgi:hypothetical protein
VTTLKSSLERKIFFRKKTPCNKHQKISTTLSLFLADPPESGISKISEDASGKKRDRRLFRQLSSDARAAGKICKVWSFEHGSWVWARIAQTFPITSKQAFSTQAARVSPG